MACLSLWKMRKGFLPASPPKILQLSELTLGHKKPLLEDLVWPLPYDVDACAGAYHGGDNGQKQHCTRSEHRCVECGGA